MNEMFSRVLNMSLTGSLVILCVMVVRLLLKRAPKIFSYALWAVVLFRLLCPVSVPSPVSVLEVTKPQVAQTAGVTSTVSYLPVEYVYTQRQPVPRTDDPARETARSDTEPAKAPLSPMTIAAWIWLAGIAVMAVYSGVVYIRLRRKLVGAVLYRGEVYLADPIGSPFVLGILRPRICLPSSIPVKERRFIIAHERHHIRRGDHIIKLLAYGALCIHWFNPLVWAAFLLAGKDMEMSCDEAVIRKLGDHIRADYSASLLRLATGHKIISGTPLSFGEGDPKGRIRNMARWKKPKVWVVAVCVVVCIAVLAACAVNPEKDAAEETGIQMDAFAVTLPEGFSYETGADGSLTISDGTQNVGGLTVRNAPEFPLVVDQNIDMQAWNLEEWIAALGLPEAEDETMAHWAEVSAKGPVEVQYWPDAAGNTVKSITHYLYPNDPVVYDLWFDENFIERDVVSRILDGVEIAAHGEPGSGNEVPDQTAALAIPEPTAEADGERFRRSGSFTGTDGTVEYTWELDTLLNTGDYPHVEVQRHQLTEEEARRAAYALFGDADFYQTEETFEEEYTKEELQKKIAIWTEYTDVENVAWLYPYRQKQEGYWEQEAELAQSFVEEYTPILAQAPEVKNDPPCDWTFRGLGISAQLEVDGIPYRFSAYSGGGLANTIWAYIDTGAGPSRLENDHYEAVLCRTEAPTPEQIDAAKAKAMQVLDALEIGSWYIDECYVNATDVGTEDAPVMQYQIVIGAMRQIQGQTPLRWAKMMDYWNPEGAVFEFAPNGEILSFKLNNTFEESNLVSSQVQTLSIEELMDMAQSVLSEKSNADFGEPSDSIERMKEFAGEEIIARVDISEVRYGLIRCAVPGKYDDYQYIPAVILWGAPSWCGRDSGEVYMTYRDGFGTETRRLLCLSAIDGSVLVYPD